MSEAGGLRLDWHLDSPATTARPAESKARLVSNIQQASQTRSASEQESEVDKHRSSKLVMACQVPGCPADLHSMREYHQRYKICDLHLKAPAVFRGGHAQRFCQQCGRFQGLEEFEGDKRSCRERLEKHNARRRQRREKQNGLKALAGNNDSPTCDAQPASEAPKGQEGGPRSGAGEKGAACAKPAAGRRTAARAAVAATPVSEEQQATPFADALAQRHDSLEILSADLGMFDDDFFNSVLSPCTLLGQAGMEFLPVPFLQMDPSQSMGMHDNDFESVLTALTRGAHREDAGAGSGVGCYLEGAGSTRAPGAPGQPEEALGVLTPKHGAATAANSAQGGPELQFRVASGQHPPPQEVQQEAAQGDEQQGEQSEGREQGEQGSSNPGMGSVGMAGAGLCRGSSGEEAEALLQLYDSHTLAARASLDGDRLEDVQMHVAAARQALAKARTAVGQLAEEVGCLECEVGAAAQAHTAAQCEAERAAEAAQQAQHAQQAAEAELVQLRARLGEADGSSSADLCAGPPVQQGFPGQLGAVASGPAAADPAASGHLLGGATMACELEQEAATGLELVAEVVQLEAILWEQRQHRAALESQLRAVLERGVGQTLSDLNALVQLGPTVEAARVGGAGSGNLVQRQAAAAERHLEGVKGPSAGVRTPLATSQSPSAGEADTFETPPAAKRARLEQPSPAPLEAQVPAALQMLMGGASAASPAVVNPPGAAAPMAAAVVATKVTPAAGGQSSGGMASEVAELKQRCSQLAAMRTALSCELSGHSSACQRLGQRAAAAHEVAVAAQQALVQLERELLQLRLREQRGRNEATRRQAEGLRQGVKAEKVRVARLDAYLAAIRRHTAGLVRLLCDLPATSAPQ